jgi:3-polyprenyl-4-hydroxybenzoate decarboxylase
MLTKDDVKAAVLEAITTVPVRNLAIHPGDKEGGPFVGLPAVLAYSDKKADLNSERMQMVLQQQVTMQAVLQQVVAGSPDGIRAAFNEGIAALQAKNAELEDKLSRLDVHVTLGTDPAS